MENINPASLLVQATQERKKGGHPVVDSAISFEQLPREVLIRVASKLANDVSALKSLCVTCRGFADIFRDAHLWNLLIFERWGVAPAFGVEHQQRLLPILQKDFAKSVSRSSLSTQSLRAKINKVPRGQYQLLLHKATQRCTYNSTFTIAVNATDQSTGWKLMSTFAEPFYDNSAIIATSSFPIQLDDCTILIEFDSMPIGLRSVQLKKLHFGEVAVVSPQWVKVASSNDYPPWDTCAGSERDGDALWVGLRLGASHAELGRMGPRSSFLYGRHGSYREESAPHATFQGRAVYPAVLVNLDQYEWVTRQCSDLHSLSSRAVPMGQSSDGILHAARVLFRGWEEDILLQHDHHVMKLSGPVLSVLPGKVECSRGNKHTRSMFTWEGKATGGHAVRLSTNQEIQVLCYKAIESILQL